MKGQELYKKARRLIPGGTQLLSKRPELYLPDNWPSYYSKASGPFVWDLDGKRYVDMSLNGIGACPLGAADPDVNAAVKRAVDNGSMSTLNTPDEVALAETLIELHPWANQVRYARTGGEAMAIAIRIGRAAAGREHVALCGYHGWSDWYLAANLGDGDALGGDDFLLPGLDTNGVPPQLKGTTSTFRYNQIGDLKKLVERHGSAIGVIVCEPQRSTAPKPGFLEQVRSIANSIGAVLIFDEVTSGFRKNTGGLHLQLGVEPDIAVFGKALGNGFAMSAVIGRREIMSAAQDTFISSTYWTESIGPAAALATIRKHREIDAGGQLVEIGQRVIDGWRRCADGLRLEIKAGPDAMPPLAHMSFKHDDARAVRTLYCQMMLDRGYLDNCSFYATTTHDEALIDSYLTVVSDVLIELDQIVADNLVISRLRGPVGHSGFARLTD